MSQMMKQRLMVFALATAFVFTSGCSSENPKSVFNPDASGHPANWLPAEHKKSAEADITACTQCHGASLDGGVADLSCTSCHLGGTTAIHPAEWSSIFSHGPYVNTAPTGTAACANLYCHGTSLAGVTDSGPSCTSCHSLPYTPASVACGSCHALPPSGTQAPDIAGSHAVHEVVCNACHEGSDGVTGTGAHYNGTVNVSVQAAYNAYGSTASYDAAGYTCSNVSCHGGRTTPDWRTGSIDVNTQCTSCHAVSTPLTNPQYNSAYTGEHDRHVNAMHLACTLCHDTTALAANHFTHLDTTIMEGPAADTLRTETGYDGASCNPSAGGLTGCHSSKKW